MEGWRIEQIYEENATCVYKYLFCLTRDSDLSEELTQETFYQATKGISKFKGDCKVSVWLCQIAKRLWYKELEKRKKGTVPLEELETGQGLDKTIEGDCILHMDVVQLYHMLHDFDEKTREVMHLRLTGLLSFKEIGNIVGESETWARVTFYRGKQKLVKGMEINE